MHRKLLVIGIFLFIGLAGCQIGELPEDKDLIASWQVSFNRSGVYDGVNWTGDSLRLTKTGNDEDIMRHRNTARLFDSGKDLSGLAFDDDGTKMYLSHQDHSIHLFSLSQPWNLTDIEKVGEAQDAGRRIEDLFFKNNGSDMYTLSTDHPNAEYPGNQLIRWNASSPYSVEQTTKKDRESLTKPDRPQSMYLADDENIFIADRVGVHKYAMREGEVDSIEYQANMSIQEDGSAADIWFDEDGETMIVLIGYHNESSQEKIRAYSLAEPWDLSTARQSYEHTIPRPRANHGMAFAFDPGRSTVFTAGRDDTLYGYEYNPPKDYVVPGTYVSDWYDWNQTVNVTAVEAKKDLNGGTLEITVEASMDGETTNGGEQVSLSRGQRAEELTAVTGQYTRIRAHLDSEGYSTPVVTNISISSTGPVKR